MSSTRCRSSPISERAPLRSARAASTARRIALLPQARHDAGLGQQDAELLAAQASQHVLRAQVATGDVHEMAQRLVAARVAVPVVRVLEMIDIDDEQAAGVAEARGARTSSAWGAAMRTPSCGRTRHGHADPRRAFRSAPRAGDHAAPRQPCFLPAGGCSSERWPPHFPTWISSLRFVSPIFYTRDYRGLTHSLPLAPLWALAIAWLCAVSVAAGIREWRAYFGVTVMGIMLHILGDLITSDGTMALAPFSDARYAWDTTFIIDLWFTGILLAGLLISWLWRRSRVPAVLGLVVVATYVGWQATQRHAAVAFGKGYAAEQGSTARVTAQPRPVLPLTGSCSWSDGERLDYAVVRLAPGDSTGPATDGYGLPGEARRSLPAAQPCHMGDDAALRRSPGGRRSLARAAWQSPRFAFYRWFAAYPVVYRVDRGNPEELAYDSGPALLRAGRPTMPFRYGLCREGGGHGASPPEGNNAKSPVQ